MSQIYDVIIIGAGPAGLTAALYASRSGLSTVIVENEMFGGALMNRDLLIDYPGVTEILGPDLASQMLEQASLYGAEIQMGTVEKILLNGDQKTVKTDVDEYAGKTIIITGGSDAKHLGIPGEEKFSGKGVIHCASCDGPLYKEKVVAVAGGGNDAVYEARSLAKFASKVLLIHPEGKLRADKFLIEKALAKAKIESVPNVNVTSVIGDDTVTGIEVTNIKTGEVSKLDVYGICIAIGQKPNTGYLVDIIECTANGAIPVDRNMATETPGVFAAGNIREGSPMKIASAVGDGANAAMAAANYLNTEK